jgi:hypothetical protein
MVTLAHLVVQAHIAGVSGPNAPAPLSAMSAMAQPGDSAGRPPTLTRDRPQPVSAHVRLPAGTDWANAYGGHLTF